MPRSRGLRGAAIMLVAIGVIGPWWPPMHLRGVDKSLTDTLHIVWTCVTVPLMLLAIGFASGAYERWFRGYSIATVVVLVVFGMLTAMYGPRLGANLPTPWAGVTERVNIGGYLLWVVVLALEALSAPRLAAAPTWRLAGRGA